MRQEYYNDISMENDTKSSTFYVVLVIVLLLVLSTGTYVLFAQGIMPAALFLSWGKDAEETPSVGSEGSRDENAPIPAPEPEIQPEPSLEPTSPPAPIPEPAPAPEPAPSPTPAPAPVPTAVPIETSAVFRGSFRVSTSLGVQEVTYTLSYPAPRVSAEFSSADHSFIGVREGRRTHTIRIFSNTDADIPTSAEVWRVLKVDRLCPSCAEVEPTIFPEEASDVVAFANTTDEIVIYYRAPVYVIMHLKKPNEDIKSILEKFSVAAGVF